MASEELSLALASSVAALGDDDVLTVAELASAGIVVWAVRRDRAGTPRSEPGPQVPWTSLYRDGELDEEALRQLTWAHDRSRLVLVCSSPEDQNATWALGALRTAFPHAMVFRGAAAVDDLIGQAIAAAPLTRLYELVVLRRAASGKLWLALRTLFPVDAERGATAPALVRCEPSDERGTVFAVVASERLRQFRLVSVQSVKLAPGPYDLIAELQGPGQVHFHGLPRQLRQEHRSWAELVRSVPERLPPLEPVHLICAVEVSGAREQVEERLSRARQLIEAVASRGNDRLRVSLIGYGPHAVIRGELDQPPAVPIWAGSSAAAITALARLSGSDVTVAGYSLAAQIECMLARVAGELTEEHGRPILVTVGSRPPFPRRVDYRSEIIPCPRRSDWRQILEQLNTFPGIAFGAIHDRAPEGIWAELSRDAFANGDAADLTGFAVALGLLSPATQTVPFPLVDEERG